MALRCLLQHCPNPWPMELCWDACGVDKDIGRAKACTAVFNVIIRQLGRRAEFKRTIHVCEGGHALESTFKRFAATMPPAPNLKRRRRRP